MVILNCKMCGGSLDIDNESSVAECSFCGTKQTVPKLDDNTNTAELFNKANDFRVRCDFDRAERIYEQIIEANPTESEAYWGLILCKFGIEYVKDPASGNRIPTCHRTSYDPIVTDINYKNALKFANVVQKPIYESEAKQIDDIQKGILTLAREEEPYDIFICYKETDASGGRTPDSSLANDIYYQMVNQGYKVFYAAITLEDKLGTAYEPYIFAALNSAKIMLVIGTKPEYFKAVWVKNEWSRYLQIIKNDMKKVLIPCYRDMDAYDLPEEFAHIQSLDIGKIGFINDIERACERVCGKKQAFTVQAPTQNNSYGANIANLIRRIYNFLDDGDFTQADVYCEKVLDIDSDCGEAYIGKYLVQHKLRSIEDLSTHQVDKNDRNYRAVMRSGDENAKKIFNEAIESYNESVYQNGCSAYNSGSFDEAIKLFSLIKGYKDSDNYATLAEEGKKKAHAEEVRQKCQAIYDEATKHYKKAMKLLNPDTYTLEQRPEVSDNLKKANELFVKLPGFKDSLDCINRIIEATHEFAYLNFLRLYENGLYDVAIKIASNVPEGYKDFEKVYEACNEALLAENKLNDYNEAVNLFNKGMFEPAKNKFVALGDYEDASEYVYRCDDEMQLRADAYERYLTRYPIMRRKAEIIRNAEPIIRELNQKEEARKKSGCLNWIFLVAGIVISLASIIIIALEEVGSGIFFAALGLFFIIFNFRPVFIINGLKSKLKDFYEMQKIPMYKYEDWKE